MKHLRAVNGETSTAACWGVRVLMLCDGSDLSAAERLSALGGRVETETELFTALGALIDDPLGYGLFVMDTDAFGGVDAGARAFSILRAADVRLPVILIGQAGAAQIFPQERSAPIMLQAPLSMVSLRVGFEHALQDRVNWRAA